MQKASNAIVGFIVGRLGINLAGAEVLEVRESRSKPDRGTVRVHTRVLNQDGTLVAQFKRIVLVPKREV